MGSALVRAWEGTEVRITDPSDADLVMLCVPDDAIAKVSQTYAGRPMAHVSGAHPAAILAGDGPRTAIHPLQTVTSDEPKDVFRGVRFSVEGDEALRELAHRVVAAAGGIPVDVTADQKQAIHIAAVILSNFSVGLHLAADEVLAGAGLGAEADALLRSLLDRTLANIRSKGAMASLTGPAARGDEATIRAHADAIEDGAIRELYLAFSAYLRGHR